MRGLVERGANAVPGSYIFDATEENFETTVIAASNQTPIVVDFWADWCPPCRVITPILEKLVEEYQGRFLLAKVEADENMRLAGRYQLRGFPTVLLIQHGAVVEQFSGAKPASFIRQFLDPHLAKFLPT